jgi:dihydroorotase
VLNLLRPGDILTHAFSGAGNNTVQNGRVVPPRLEAKRRGVVVDVGHGGGSFDYTVFEPARDQGFGPDTISSDLHAVSGNTPGMPFLPWVMSKFLNNGYYAGAGGGDGHREAGAGHRPGGEARHAAGRRPGDVSILELVQEPVEFVDTRNNRRRGDRWLKPVQTVKAAGPLDAPSRRLSLGRKWPYRRPGHQLSPPADVWSEASPLGCEKPVVTSVLRCASATP